MSMIAKNRTKSSWTPLSNEETNNKIYEERYNLLGKWYDKWSDEQRKRVLADLLNRSKIKQLKFAQEIVNEKVPYIRQDFTRELPRVLSTYILSYLDPRSLSRCAQVCWYWKTLSERDELWMPKCVRYGWFLPFTPSPYESGVWKRNYIENIRHIQVLRPRDTALTLEKLKLEADHKRAKSAGTMKDKHKPTPWRGSDPRPTDIWRYNVLENDDVVEQVSNVRKKKGYGSSIDDISRNARSKVKTGQNILNQTRKSQSLSGLYSSELTMSHDRPQWATATNPHISFDAKVKDKNLRNKSPIRNGSKPVTARSDRDPPTARLFPEKPWNVPDNTESDDDHF